MMARGGFIRRFDDGTPGTVAVNGDYNLGFSPDGYLPGAMYNKPSQPSLILDPATGNYYAAGFTPASQLSNQNPETVAVTDERKKKPVTLNSGSAVTITNPDTGETYQTVLPDGMQLADSQVTPVVKPDEVQLADSQATPITDFDAERLRYMAANLLRRV